MKTLQKLSISSVGLAFGLMASGMTFAQSPCSTTYSVNSWGSGGQVDVSVTNTGPTLDDWELCWSFNGSEAIVNLWDGEYTASGRDVCVQNAGYNGTLGTDATAEFGFLVENPADEAPTNFTLNGESCNGSGASSSAQNSSSQSSDSNGSSPSVAARWLVDADRSSFNFVSVKNADLAEMHTFEHMQGTVAPDGSATLTIALASINSGIDIRDTRMQDFLFESSYLPSLHFTTELDTSAVEDMPVGGIQEQSISGNLILHGIVRPISFDVTIVKHSNTSISVAPRRPILINSVDFELDAGVETLRTIAGLDSIGETVPVYFNMHLTRDNPTDMAAIVLPEPPAVPVGLSGDVVQDVGEASLVWSVVSENETGFLVRRRDESGRWTTEANLPANTSLFTQDLLDAQGSYDYKVIGYRESVPASATAPVTVVYGSGASSSSSQSSSSGDENGSSSAPSSSSSSGSNSSSGSGGSGGYDGDGDAERGAQLWSTYSCAACHGVDGEWDANGNPASNPLNPNRSYYRHSQDSQDRTLSEFISMWMPVGNAESCTGECADDLEAYIRSWRRPSDGIPDNPVSYFSCPSNAPVNGQRTLRLLTKNEVQRSVQDLVGYTGDLISRLPDDFNTGAFVNNNTLIVDRSRYTSYVSNAERIAEDAASRWYSVLSCSPGDNGCAEALVDELGPRIFRRPLTTDERMGYLDVARGELDGRTPAEGMEIALAAMLSSPQFLYRSEAGEDIGGGIYKLTGYEMATYLSYTFVGTTPSEQLLAAAERGELDSATGIRQHAAELLDSPSARVRLDDFVNRWLGTHQLGIQEREGIADFESLAVDMQAELSKNFAHAMLDGDTSFADVYSPSYTHVNERLADLYGLPFSSSGADADGFARVSTSERGGILTSGAFMSRYATADDANLVTRAVAVRRRLMCQDIPEPPSGVSLDREALAARDQEFFEDPHTTQRMLVDRITSGTTCANCHAEIINPLGGSMQDFDMLGRLRTSDIQGNAIDALGTFYSPFPQLQFLDDPDRVMHEPAIQMEGARDLAHTIVEDPMVSDLAQSCLTTQFMSYSSGVHSIFLIDSDRDVGYSRISEEEEAAYRCDISDLTHVLNTRGPRAMLEELPALNSVMYRQEWAR